MGTSVEIVIPDIGDDEEVEVVEVLVNVGDTIAIDDPLITLESDKASLDVPSTAAGRITKIVVKTGDRVRQGSIVAVIETTSDASATTASETGTSGTVQTAGASVADRKSAAESPTAAPVARESQPQPGAAQASESGATGETIDILVPDVGSDEAVEVIEILVNVGDVIELDAALLTLESDKASMDVPSPFAGTIEKIHVSVGDQVQHGHLLASISSAGSPANATPGDSELSMPRPVEPARPRPEASIASATPTATAGAVTTPPDAAAVHIPSTAHASPSVRRFARELGADLNQIKGTGRKGRILVEDVQSWVKSRLSGAGAAGGSAIPSVPVIDFSKFGETEEVRLSRIKRLSGPHLKRAWLNAPHVTHHDEADITDLEEFRRSMKEEVAAQGIKLTPLVFIMRALVAAMKKFPQFNASLSGDGESIVYKKYFNIGIAVDTPEGLVVPVIREVDSKGYIELAIELAEVSQRARDGALKPADIQGGCISISSLGGIGGTAFTPIINVPEVAILGVARARMAPVWDGEKFKARRLLPLDLSYDHRAIDGAEAARFVSFLVNGLGDIRRLSM